MIKTTIQRKKAVFIAISNFPKPFITAEKLDEKIILQVEDNPDDILLTQRAIKESHILNNIVVAKDGVEALVYFFGTGN